MAKVGKARVDKLGGSQLSVCLYLCLSLPPPLLPSLLFFLTHSPQKRNPRYEECHLEACQLLTLHVGITRRSSKRRILMSAPHSQPVNLEPVGERTWAPASFKLQEMLLGSQS